MYVLIQIRPYNTNAGCFHKNRMTKVLNYIARLFRFNQFFSIRLGDWRLARAFEAAREASLAEAKCLHRALRASTPDTPHNFSVKSTWILT
jgi:hypothetical protein